VFKIEKTLEVIIKPRSREQSVKKISESLLEVRLKSAPEKGKANKELKEVLSYFFGVYKDKIEIVKGLKSRRKIVKIELYPGKGKVEESKD